MAKSAASRAPRVLLASRAIGIHERRFAAAIEDGGGDVRSLGLGATAPADRPAAIAAAAASIRAEVVVAGPILDVTLAAARAGLRPLVGISYAFDLLGEVHAPGGEAAAREALASCDLLVCDAQVVAAAAVALGMAADAITRFPWGVDLERFRPRGPDVRRDARARLAWPREATVVLSARAHEPLYRLPMVLAAFTQAAAVREDFRLVVLGDGSERPVLEAAVAAGPVADRVHFEGVASPAELARWYAAADVLVSAAQVDGASVSLLEAMACGLPAVVPRVGGNAEWVIPGETGWLVPPDDTAAMAQALVDAASLRPAERVRMAAAARARVEARADWRDGARTFAEAVRRVASGVEG